MKKSIPFRDPQKRKKQVDILYIDDHLIAVHKPAGIPVIPDRWSSKRLHLIDLLERFLQQETGSTLRQVYTVHRIDADTSGVVLMARNPDMHRELSGLFEEQQIQKTYLAIVRGRPSRPEGIIDLPLSRSSSGKKLTRIDAQGKPSRTDYRLVEEFRNFALLEVQPKSGRTHQIRVHLRNIGCPLAVDPLYNPGAALAISDIKPGVHRDLDDRSGLINRLTLHARSLAFLHPVDNRPIEIEAPLPRDFNAALKALRRWNSLPG